MRPTIGRVYAIACIAAGLAGWLSGNSYAAYETPETTAVKVYLPYNGPGEDKSFRMTDQLVDQGYNYNASTDKYTDESATDDDPEDCTIGNFKGLLESGANLWWTTHGNTSMIAIEQYSSSTAVTNRWNAIKDYYSPQHIGTYVDSQSGIYAIIVHAAGLAAWCTPKKQIIFMSSCYSAALFASVSGGLELGYDDLHNDNDVDSDADVLFRNMSGRRSSAAKRRSFDALLPVNDFTAHFCASGSIRNDMVLTPTVKAYSPTE